MQVDGVYLLDKTFRRWRIIVCHGDRAYSFGVLAAPPATGGLPAVLALLQRSFEFTRGAVAAQPGSDGQPGVAAGPVLAES